MSTPITLTWNEEVYGLGIKKIDDQHKVLLNLIAALGQAKTGDLEFIGKVLNTLVEYTKNHFSDEEKLLKKMHFPNLENHSRQHKKFVETVEVFRQDFLKTPDSQVLLNKIVDFLGKWLTQHILIEDREYAAFLFA